MVDLNCHNNSAAVSWNSANGANAYKVTAESADGFRSSCETKGNQCNLTKLQCGQKYNVILTSISDNFQIDTRTNLTFNSRKLAKVSSELLNGRHYKNFSSVYFIFTARIPPCFSFVMPELVVQAPVSCWMLKWTSSVAQEPPTCTGKTKKAWRSTWLLPPPAWE